ncbi:4'-phosphopantetheinyl transferase family protein [Flexivirga alba]|uniref:4'-phosphopantetheinyl transferase family protein n=1 Tax=Flexivirga alba TaxID=702742 RepID=A0ABW2AJ29_9MICO
MTEDPSTLVVDGHLSAEALVNAAALPGVLVHRCGHCGSTEHGQPVLVGGPFVSIARSSMVSVIAWWAEGPVGVDVEIAGATPPPELTLHPAEEFGDVLAVWVRKEAVLKALGTGLRTDPRTIRLSAQHGAATVTGTDLQVHELHVPGHVAALSW